MKSVVYASVRVVDYRVLVGLCALCATACVEGDPIPEDVVQRAEAVLLEGAIGGAPSTSASATSTVPAGSVAPAASSAFLAIGAPPVLPEVNELGAEIGEDAIPDNAIPLADWLAQ